MSLKRFAGWLFRLYLIVLFGGLLVSGVGWYTRGLANMPWIGTLWYGIAGIGTITLLVLVATRLRSKDPTEPLF